MEVVGGLEPVNPFLVEAMRRVTIKDSVRTRKTFYGEVLRSTFLVPLSEEAEIPADGRMGRGQVPLVMGKDEQGYLHMLAFTDVKTFGAWSSEQHHAAVMPAQTLLTAAVANGIETLTINYKHPQGVTLTRDKIEALALGQIPSKEKT